MLRGFADLGQLDALPGLRELLEEQVGEADDGVHRRADLMAHVGQESALGAVRRLGCVLGVGQFGGARVHQLFQVMTVLRQFGGGTVAFG
ncbi:MAG: hypothetical protein AW11_03796 [Candidatus Accumulibacter regalis]|uniref:Uncharacterized protein n=1 Tax=Accumulibacter regalis TaxID=522306 RepID=A0A011NP74_ACCRE|nr:MAG: hypothetical protein AW11_03796 [Candidatus Accumulibacter regalis]